MNLHTRKCIIFLMAFQFFIVCGLLPAARAALVPTQTLLGATAADNTRGQIATMLARDDVRAELLRLGVEPKMAEERLAALTPAELQLLQHQMDQLPAGAGGEVFAVIGIVFVILLILELVGVTNIFSKI